MKSIKFEYPQVDNLLPTWEYSNLMDFIYWDFFPKKIFFNLLKRRWGTLIVFWKIFRPPGAYKDTLLIDFQDKNSDQDVFTPDLLYFQFFLRKNACLTPICSIFPDIIHLLALSMIVLLEIIVNFSISKINSRTPCLSRPPFYWILKNSDPLFINRSVY